MWAHYFNTCRCATVLKLLLLSVTVIVLHLEIVGPQTVEWSLHQASVLMTSAVSHKCGLTQKKRRAQWRKLTMVLKFAELKILRHCCKPKGVKGPPIWYFHLFVFPVCKMSETHANGHTSSDTAAVSDNLQFPLHTRSLLETFNSQI